MDEKALDRKKKKWKKKAYNLTWLTRQRWQDLNTASLSFLTKVQGRGQFAQSLCTQLCPERRSCPWVHFVWTDPMQPISLLTQPDPTQFVLGIQQQQLYTTTVVSYSLLVTYFNTQNVSSTFIQPSRKIKFDCLVQPNLIRLCFKRINIILSNFSTFLL